MHVLSILSRATSANAPGSSSPRITNILRLKGFPSHICDWVLSFLTDQTVSLKIGNFISDVFTIHNGTPQGSPLSPILSVFYTAPLLDLASSWHYHDLTLYVNDGAIYV